MKTKANLPMLFAGLVCGIGGLVVVGTGIAAFINFRDTVAHNERRRELAAREALDGDYERADARAYYARHNAKTANNQLTESLILLCFGGPLTLFGGGLTLGGATGGRLRRQ